MGQRQTHRGKHSEDDQLFSPKWTPVLRAAVADLSYLLTHRYADKAAKKLVGDHYQLDLRQRMAVERCACSDASLAYRTEHNVPIESLRGCAVAVDGYNLLIGLECMLAGAILLRGRDGCIRDIASIHGSYRKVEETLPALQLAGAIFEEFGVGEVTWHFDSPISNSGRLRALFLEEATREGWPWKVDLDTNPDKLLVTKPLVVTSDGWILDHCQAWANVLGYAVEKTGATPIDLST